MLFVCRFLLIIVTLGVLDAPAGAAEAQANAIFLVAKRELSDPNFRETVVLVTHPPQGGPFGVIVNRPLGARLSDVFPDQPSLKGRKEVLYFGGPVGRQGLVFLVRSPKPPPGVTMVLRDVFFTSDVELIEKLLQRKDPLAGLRIYMGYSGWAAGQLQNEIARGGWHVVPADAETVFDRDPARLWLELIERATARQVRAEPPAALPVSY
jgi:putative transcriptional regulator